ncbi:hypothetical protein BDZ97DRAFT_1918973 [Flammula alnicola]|nr:hypothetical protein BDZ97DRAFT_1918973 [Flammula alnicola]
MYRRFPRSRSPSRRHVPSVISLDRPRYRRSRSRSPPPPPPAPIIITDSRRSRSHSPVRHAPSVIILDRRHSRSHSRSPRWPAPVTRRSRSPPPVVLHRSETDTPHRIISRPYSRPRPRSPRREPPIIIPLVDELQSQYSRSRSPNYDRRRRLSPHLPWDGSYTGTAMERTKEWSNSVYLECDATTQSSRKADEIDLLAVTLDFETSSIKQSAIERPADISQCSSLDAKTYILAFVLDTLPRQLYLYLLLCLPYMYFSRVTRIFEEAEMNMPQIKQGILEAAIQLKEPLSKPWRLEPSIENAPYNNLQKTWQTFIDLLLREWKTLNIILVLLLS